MRAPLIISLLLIIFATHYHSPLIATTYNTITVDGSLSDWSSDELLGIRNTKSAYLTWDNNSLYIAYSGTDFGVESDFFIYFDTIPSSGTNITKDWYGRHQLPFYADYLFWIENGNPGANGLDKYSSTTGWSLTTFTGQTYIGWSGNNITEIKIPFIDISTTLNNTIRIIIYAQWEDALNVWNSFPMNNSASQSGSEIFEYYYEFVLQSGISPNKVDYIKKKSSAGNQTDDTIPPNIYFISPEDNEIITIHPLRIEVSATDNIGVEKVILTIDEVFRTLMSFDGSKYYYIWSNYSRGTHTLKVTAYDFSNNSKTLSINVTYKPPSNPNPIKVAIIWHMHQPMYKNYLTGKYELPWTRVHTVQEYIDHPLILKKYPDVKIVYNFVPSLGEQIKDIYEDKNYSDPHWTLALKPVNQLTIEEKEKIKREFFWIAKWQFTDTDNANRRYAQLVNKVDTKQAFTDQDFIDLKALYHLLQISKPLVKGEYPGYGPYTKLWELRNKTTFTEADVRYILDMQVEISKLVLLAYKNVLNQAEITTTPYYHPIMPLLLKDNWTGGVSNIKVQKGIWRDDAKKQLDMAREWYYREFGKEPVGLWPSEEAVSDIALETFSEKNFTWFVSSAEVLDNTLQKLGIDVVDQSAGNTVLNAPALYKPYLFNIGGKKIYGVFRDSGISNRLTSAVFGNKDPEIAVDEFIQYIYTQGSKLSNRANSIITIAADGENWMFWDDAGFKENGRAFLNKLYQRLQSDTNIQLVTVSEFLSNLTVQNELKHIEEGSWMYGDLETWKGEPDEDLAWLRLATARQTLIEASKNITNTTKIENGWKSIYPAEGSDWFWWYGTDQTTNRCLTNYSRFI